MSSETVVWTVDIDGSVTVFDTLTGSWQAMPNLEFEILEVDGADTILLDSVRTDTFGVYTSTVSSGAFNLRYRFSSKQEHSLFPVRKAASPNDYYEGLYNTFQSAQQNRSINVGFSPALPVTNSMLNPAFRIMRDLETTDSILHCFDQFPSFELIENSVLVYLDSSDVADTNGTYWGADTVTGNGHIVVDYSLHLYQMACHELGHHAMFMMQKGSARPPCPSDTLSQHAASTFSDTIFAFDEGFAKFIHSISSVPESLTTHGQHIETNDWWLGPPPGNPSIDSGEIVEGSVASILYDLYDNNVIPACRLSSEDDSVVVGDMMLQAMFDCISNFADSTNQTRSLPTLAARLVRDSASSWHNEHWYRQARDAICDVFADHHYHVPSTDWCKGSSVSEDQPGSRYEPALPLYFRISQNYPNPFNSSTHIRFVAPYPAEYTLEVFNVLGQSVHQSSSQLPAGENVFTLGGQLVEDWSSGMYFYRVSGGGCSETKQMLLLK